MKASLSSLLESSSHSSSEGSAKRAQRTGLEQADEPPGSPPSGATRKRPSAKWERTVSAAHVDDDLQSGLLSCQQSRGLAQLLLSGLWKRANGRPLTLLNIV